MAEGSAADLVVGNNVLAQVPNINDFVGGIQILLKPSGTATLEFPHLLRTIEGNQFDQIYHEHFSYFSLLAVERIVAAHGLLLYDVEELPTHGGSLRIFLRRAETAGPDVSSEVGRLRDAETGAGLADPTSYARFGGRVADTKRKLLAFLIKAKSDGRRIVGYGAPGKGNTLLNYCGIRSDFLDYLVDRNPYKHGRFSPGTHIPIYPPDRIDETKPDLVLILPWNLKSEIMHQMRHVAEWGCRFVVPIPEVDAGRRAKARRMRVVLFCGGLGTRIRDYSENVPKPMVPVGNQPILWHPDSVLSTLWSSRLHSVPRFQGQCDQGILPELSTVYGIRGLRCLWISADGSTCWASPRRTGASPWSRPACGATSASGSRRPLVRKGRGIFLANYSDGLSDLALDQMTSWFERSGKVAAFVAVQPNFAITCSMSTPMGRW